MDFKNNQGVINGRMSRLIDKPDKLAEYAETLTQAQRDLARAHVKTLMKLKRK